MRTRSIALMLLAAFIGCLLSGCSGEAITDAYADNSIEYVSYEQAVDTEKPDGIYKLCEMPVVATEPETSCYAIYSLSDHRWTILYENYPNSGQCKVTFRRYHEVDIVYIAEGETPYYRRLATTASPEGCVLYVPKGSVYFVS